MLHGHVDLHVRVGIGARVHIGVGGYLLSGVGGQLHIGVGGTPRIPVSIAISVRVPTAEIATSLFRIRARSGHLGAADGTAVIRAFIGTAAPRVPVGIRIGVSVGVRVGVPVGVPVGVRVGVPVDVSVGIGVP